MTDEIENVDDLFVSVDIMARHPPELRAEIKAKFIFSNELAVQMEDKGIEVADLTDDTEEQQKIEETLNGHILDVTFSRLQELAAMIHAAPSKAAV